MTYNWDANNLYREAIGYLEQARDTLLRAIDPETDGSHTLDKLKITGEIYEISKLIAG